MNFGSSFTRNEFVDPYGGNWVRNERIVTRGTFSDGDSSHPSSSSESSRITKVTLPQFFAKADPWEGPGVNKNDGKASPTMVTEANKPDPFRIEMNTSRRMDPPGLLANEEANRHRKSAKRNKSKTSSKDNSSSGRKHKDERRKKKESRRKQTTAQVCCDETTVSWTRTPSAVKDLDFRGRRPSNDGQLLRLKANKSRSNLALEASADLTSTTTKSTTSDVSEIAELVRRIQNNPKSPNPRTIRNDRRSIQSSKRASRGLERKKSSSRLTMVASPSKHRKGTAAGRKNSVTGASLVDSAIGPTVPTLDNTAEEKPKKEHKCIRRNSVAPLDFSEFETDDFSSGDAVGIVEVTED